MKIYTTKTSEQIAHNTGLSKATVDRIYARVIERGFDYNSSPKIIDDFVKDKPRSGRPRKQDLAKDTIISKVQHDRFG
jgi:transposase